MLLKDRIMVVKVDLFWLNIVTFIDRILIICVNKSGRLRYKIAHTHKRKLG